VHVPSNHGVGPRRPALCLAAGSCLQIPPSQYTTAAKRQGALKWSEFSRCDGTRAFTAGVIHEKQPCHPARLTVHGLRALQGGAGHLRQRAGGPLLHALAVQQVRLQRIAAGYPLQSVASWAERETGLSF